MSKKLSMDIRFTFEDDGGLIDKIVGICTACQRGYRSHEIFVHFTGWRGEEYGEKFAQEGVHYGYSVLCADCILSSPLELGEHIRANGEKILRKPKVRKEQRFEAEGMIELAGELEKVDSLRDLPGGIMAVAIARGRKELDNQPKARKGKAA
jgi:hypothetical protein